MIGVPALTGQNDMRLTFALFEVGKLAIQRGMDVRLMTVGHDSSLPNARADLVRYALTVGYQPDDLVMIDADQDFQAEDFFRLLDHKVDVVAVPIRKKIDEVQWNLRIPGGPSSLREDPALPGLLTAPGLCAGFGIVRLSRRALQAMWDSAEPYRIGDGPEGRWMFNYAPVDGQLVGEDTYACMLLAHLGITTYIDPSIRAGHTGVKRWEGDFKVWLATYKPPPPPLNKIPPKGKFVPTLGGAAST